jgi:alpha-beta hydrolase superfamily lysophospholipase
LLRYFAKYVAIYRLLWITKKVKGDFRILSVAENAGAYRVLLPHNDDTAANGTQSLFWASRRGHALVEPAEATDEGRWFNILVNYGATPVATKGAWLSGWLGERLEHFGNLAYERVQLPNKTRAIRTRSSSAKWVVHVHGRKTLVGETLRNFSLFDSLGFNQLSFSHETDPKPLGLGKHRSTLGFQEWKQLEEAVIFAKSNGAEKVLLFGWSLGGMIVGQFLNSSKLTDVVAAAIFDSPMFDVRNTLRLQAKLSGYDEQFADEVCELIKGSKILRLLGYPKLVFDQMSLCRSALDSTVPSLVLYSKNDGYIAYEDAERFAHINRSVTLVEFPGARHCRLSNSNPAKYEETIRTFVSKLQI